MKECPLILSTNEYLRKYAGDIDSGMKIAITRWQSNPGSLTSWLSDLTATIL